MKNYLIMLAVCFIFKASYSQCPPPIMLGVTLNSTAANCAADGSITATPVGGTAPFAYQITAGPVTGPIQNSNVFNALPPGTYTVQVSDGCGDTSTETISVSGNYQAPGVTISATDTNCPGASDGSVTVNVTQGLGPFQYTLTGTNPPITIGPQGSGIFNGLAAGTYSIQLVDQCNNTQSIAAIVTDFVYQTPFYVYTNSGGIKACDSFSFGLYSNNGVFPLTYEIVASTTDPSLIGQTGVIGSPNVPEIIGYKNNSQVTVEITDACGTTVTQYNNNCKWTINLAWTETCATGSLHVTKNNCWLAPVTYEITDPPGYPPQVNNPTFSNLPKGVVYTVVATDACGNSATETKIASLNNLQLQIYSSAFVCVVGTIKLKTTLMGGSAPYTYTILSGPPGVITPQVFSGTLAGAPPGTYTVAVVDGCGATDTITSMLEGLTLNYAINVNSSCQSGSISVTGGYSRPTHYALFDINGVAIQAYSPIQVFNNLAPGTSYIVRLRAGTTSTCDFYATRDTILIPQYTQPILNASGGADCATGLGFISGSGSNGVPPYTFVITSGPPGAPINQPSGTLNYTNLPFGLYNLQLTDSCQNTISSSIAIEDYNLQIQGVPGSVCSGSDVALYVDSIYNATYVWTDPNGNTIGNSSQITLSNTIPSQSGLYQVHVISPGCVDTLVSINLVISPGLITNQTVNHVSCGGTSDGNATVTASGGIAPYSWQWAHSPVTSTISNLLPGTYYVTITDVNGCTGIDSIVINNNQGVNVTINAIGINCFGNSDGTLTANTGGISSTFVWSTGASTASITGLSANTYMVTATNPGCTSTASITLTEPDELISLINTQQSPTCSQANGIATVNVSGGTAPYNYVWNNNIVNASNNMLIGGMNTVTITDDNGCIILDSISLSDNSPVISSLQTQDASCGSNNGLASVSVTGGVAPYSYNWSNTSTQQTVTGLSAGQYQLTVTDNSGCVLTGQVSVNNSSELSAYSSIALVTCNGGADGSIQITVTSGTSPYNYTWNNNGINAPIQNNLSAGTYSVTITDANSCVFILTETLAEPPLITPSTTMVQHELCAGANNGMATVSATDGVPPYQYTWSDNTVGPSASGLSPGSYSITVTDSNGCLSVTSVTINAAPSLSASSIVVANANCNTCVGASSVTVSGGAMPYTYLWSNGSISPTASNLCSGIHLVTITDDNGCITTASVTIGNTSISIASIQEINISCNHACDGQATVLVTGGIAPFSYNWSNGQTSNPAQNLCAGNYTVTVLDANNCVAISSVNLSEPAQIVPYVSRENILCFEGSAGLIRVDSVQGDGPFFYSLDGINYQAGNEFTSVSSGNYTVYVQDQNGCEGTATAIVTQASPPVLNLYVSSSSVLLGETVDLNVYVNTFDQVTYEWIPGDGLSCSNCPNPSVTPLESTTYTVLVTDESGCESTASTVVEVDISNQFWVPNIFTPNGDGVNDQVTVFSDSGVAKVNTFRIYSRWGELLFSANEFQPNNLSLGWDGSFRGRMMSDGVFVYLAEVTFVDGTSGLQKGDITLMH